MANLVNQILVKIKITLTLMLVILLFGNRLISQDQHIIDSLILELAEAETICPDKPCADDTIKIKLLLEIGDQYEYSIPDTALNYYDRALELAQTINNKKYEAKSLYYIGFVFQNEGKNDLALKYYQNSLNVYEELKNKKGISESYNSIGLVYKNLSEFDLAIESHQKSLKISEELRDKNGIARSYGNIGINYIRQSSYGLAIEYFQKSLELFQELENNMAVARCYFYIAEIQVDQGIYDLAIKNYQKSLRIFEELGNKLEMSFCYNNMAHVHQDQSSYELALEYYQKSLVLKEELGDKKGIANTYGNLSIIYRIQGLYDLATDYYQKSFKIYKEIKDKIGMSAVYSSIADVHVDKGSYELAIEYFQKSLKIDKEIGNKNGISYVIGKIASTKIKLADSTKNQELKNIYYKQGIKLAENALNIANEINALPLKKDHYEVLQHAWKGIGDYKKAYKYSQLLHETKDSLFNEEKTKAIQEMETRYQAEKKQLEIEKLEKESALQDETIARKEAENKKQRILIFAFIAGFIIIVVFSVFLYNLFLQKKRANILLAKEKAIVEKQKKDITDSISYAKRIQHAVLPTQEQTDRILNEHFILFRPKDIVSGDFFWVTRVNKWLILTAADCTGHGVPGAFMSMLGISFLNEIVRKKEVTQANHILNELRKSVIESLQQKGLSGEQQDGMDMSLCVINTETNLCQFAGAHNPLYLIRNGELIETKGDKMPVSIHVHMREFTNHEIQLKKNDCIYLFSDGFVDQFGGDKGRKFKAKSFKQLLVEKSGLSMQEQKNALEEAMNTWVGYTDENSEPLYEQLDDITVIGIKI